MDMVFKFLIRIATIYKIDINEKLSFFQPLKFLQ